MAVKLVANYSKRLGLPGYSSHQFSVTVESELHNTDNVSIEAARLYKTLQMAVDTEIQSTGFVPDEAYGINPIASMAPINSRASPFSDSLSFNFNLPSAGQTQCCTLHH